jgi:hypothetical protein
MPNARADPLQDVASWQLFHSKLLIWRIRFPKFAIDAKTSVGSSGRQNRCSWLFNDISAAYFGENL